jgi:hypothetical protein
MSEVQSRSSARGRVSTRGGRGGYSSRGGRGGNSRAANTDNSDLAPFDEGEIGQMKKKYSDALPTLKELFPDWKDEDLVFALEDSNGEIEEAIERITEGRYLPHLPALLVDIRLSPLGFPKKQKPFHTDR